MLIIPPLDEPEAVDDRTLIYCASRTIGIGHLLCAVINYLAYCEKKNRVFGLDTSLWVWTVQDDNKLWNSFFEILPVERSITDINSVRELYKSSSSQAIIARTDGIGVSKDYRKRYFSDNNYTRHEFGKVYDSEEDFDEQTVIINSLTPPLIPYEDAIPSVHLKAEVRETFDSLFDQLFDNHFVIGVHIRHGNGEDLHGRIMGAQLIFEGLLQKYFSHIDREIENVSGKSVKILVTSDSDEVKARFKRKYGDRVVADIGLLENSKVPWQKLALRNADVSTKELLFNALKDIYWLSKVDLLLYGDSLFTDAAIYLSFINGNPLSAGKRVFITNRTAKLSRFETIKQYFSAWVNCSGSTLMVTLRRSLVSLARYSMKVLIQISNHQRINLSSATTKRLGRTDPCPCGSGKKYKKCCGGRFRLR